MWCLYTKITSGIRRAFIDVLLSLASLDPQHPRLISYAFCTTAQTTRVMKKVYCLLNTPHTDLAVEAGNCLQMEASQPPDPAILESR